MLDTMDGLSGIVVGRDRGKRKTVEPCLPFSQGLLSQPAC